MTAFSTTGHSTSGLSPIGLSTTARPTARSVLARLLVPAIAVASLAAGPALAQESGEVARIEVLSGVVTVVREAGDVAASPGLHLLAGDSLETAAGARAELLFADGTTLVVGPEAEVKLEDYLLAADGSREHGAVTLVEGVVRAVVAPGPADSFAIQGQAAVASVRGTE
ncbi:MAG: FecR family protein, partial [Azospirillaceae bacterium]